MKQNFEPDNTKVIYRETIGTDTVTLERIVANHRESYTVTLDTPVFIHSPIFKKHLDYETAIELYDKTVTIAHRSNGTKPGPIGKPDFIATITR